MSADKSRAFENSFALFLSDLEKNVSTDEINYNKAEQDNLVKSKIDKELMVSKTNKKNIENYILVFNNLYKCVVNYASNFEKERKKRLEQEITANLRYLFPHDNYEAVFNCSQSRGKETAELIINQNGTSFDIDLSMGGFVRQLISLVALFKTNKLRGSHFMVLDEALSSADKDNLLLLKPLLDRMVSEGMQLIVIEHKNEFYNSVDRKVFHFFRNKDTNTLEITKEELIDV